MRPASEPVMLGTVPHPTTDTDQGRPSDAVADRSGERTRPASGPGGSARSADRHGPPPDNESPPETNAEPSATVSGRQRPVRSWPLLVLAAPAAVAVWSGWVGIGQMTGFGEIRPLPGIWNSLHIDTAVTLPIGVEAYAAFALRAWLTRNSAVSDRTRRFARWSAIAALVLGMAGQVAYHLLTQAGVTRAPWEVTTVGSCLPVAVLGMGSALAHLLRSDAASPSSRLTSRPCRPAIRSGRDSARQTARVWTSLDKVASGPLHGQAPALARRPRFSITTSTRLGRNLRRLAHTHSARGHRPGCGLQRPTAPLPELSHPASGYHAAHFAPPDCMARTLTLACSPAWSGLAPIATALGLLRSTVKDTREANHSLAKRSHHPWPSSPLSQPNGQRRA